MKSLAKTEADEGFLTTRVTALGGALFSATQEPLERIHVAIYCM